MKRDETIKIRKKNFKNQFLIFALKANSYYFSRCKKLTDVNFLRNRA